MKLETDFNWFLKNFGILPLETMEEYLNIVNKLPCISSKMFEEAYLLLITNKRLFVGQPGIPAHEGVYRFKTDVDVNGRLFGYTRRYPIEIQIIEAKYTPNMLY